MQIKKMRLQNFGLFEKMTFNMDNSLVVVYGPNFTGKSTLAQGLFFALCGKPLNTGIKPKEMVTVSKRSAAVDVMFSHDDQMCSLHRGQTGSVRIKQQVNGAWRSVTDIAQVLPPLNPDQWQIGCFLKEDELGEFITKKPASRRDLLNQILGVEELLRIQTPFINMRRFAKREEKAYQTKRDGYRHEQTMDCQEQLDKYKQQVDELQFKLEALSDNQKNGENQRLIRELVSNQTDLDERITTKRALKNRLLKDFNNIAELKQTLADLENKRKGAEDVKQKLERIVENKMDVHAAISAMEAVLRSIREIKSDQVDLDERICARKAKEAGMLTGFSNISELKQALADAENMHKEAAKVEQQLEHIIEKRASVQTAIEQGQTVLANVRKLHGKGVCPTCYQPVPQAHIKGIESEYELKIAESHDELEMIQQSENDIRAEIDRFQKMALRASELRERLNKFQAIEESLTELNEQQRRLFERLTQLRSANGDPANQSALQQQLNAAPDNESIERIEIEYKSKIDEKRSELTSLHQKESDTRKTIKLFENLTERERELRDNLSHLVPLEEDLSELEKQQLRLAERLKQLSPAADAQGDQHAIREALQAAQRKVAQLTTQQHMHLEQKQRMNELNQMVKQATHARLQSEWIVDALERTLSDVNGQALQNVKGQITAGTEQFDMFSNQHLSLELEKLKMMPQVDHRNFQTLSASEKAILYMAMKVALSDLMPGADFFVFDNPTVHLDGQRKQTMIDYLQALTPRKQVIVLTNDLQLADTLPAGERIDL